LLSDISKSYIDIKKDITIHNTDIQYIKEDLRELKTCLSETKKLIINKK